MHRGLTSVWVVSPARGKCRSTHIANNLIVIADQKEVIASAKCMGHEMRVFCKFTKIIKFLGV